jgi:hypothetical protein
MIMPLIILISRPFLIINIFLVERRRVKNRP